MRHPVLSVFAMMSFIGATCFAVACAKDGPEIEEIPTGAADAGTSTSTTPTEPTTKPTKKPKKDAGAAAPVDAGPPDTGAPVGDDDDDDDDDDVLQANCPSGDQSYLTKYMTASQGGGVVCTSGGSECSTNECCFISPLPLPGFSDNYCVEE